MEQPPSPPLDANALDELKVQELLAALIISMFINSCLFVGEVAFVTHGPQGELRHNIDAMAHVLTGPIAFIAFFNSDFTGTFLFFMSLWHFLCDSGRARPSYVTLGPCKLQFFDWFESLWLLVHHIFIGTFKVATDLRIFNLDAVSADDVLSSLGRMNLSTPHAYG